MGRNELRDPIGATTSDLYHSHLNHPLKCLLRLLLREAVVETAARVQTSGDGLLEPGLRRGPRVVRDACVAFQHLKKSFHAQPDAARQSQAS